jgi:hypothetical protein
MRNDGYDGVWTPHFIKLNLAWSYIETIRDSWMIFATVIAKSKEMPTHELLHKKYNAHPAQTIHYIITHPHIYTSQTLLNTIDLIRMPLLHPCHRCQQQCTNNTQPRHKNLPAPDNRGSSRPEKLDNLIRLIQIFLRLDIVFVIIFGVNELQLGRKMNIGFVERDEEEGEDLMDFHEEDLGLLIEFCIRY